MGESWPNSTFTVQQYPQMPGCYIFRDKAGVVLYVGKAKNLRRRLEYYFGERAYKEAAQQPGSHYHHKTIQLIERLCDVEVILLHTELESLILENNLIKRFHPPFNVALQHEKTSGTYLIQTAEPFPRFLPYRKNWLNRALHRRGGVEVTTRFGPFLTLTIRSLLLETITETFGIRTCDPMPNKVCFYYHLKQCSGPCEGKVSKEKYAQLVSQAARYLDAPHLGLVNLLEAQMTSAAEELAFERASRIRDQIKSLRSIFERQVVERDVAYDQDVVWVENGKALIVHLHKGALHTLEITDAPQAHLGAFLVEHYHGGCPSELMTTSLMDASGIADQLSSASGHPVIITHPTTGPGFDLLDIARINHAYRSGSYSA